MLVVDVAVPVDSGINLKGIEKFLKYQEPRKIWNTKIVNTTSTGEHKQTLKLKYFEFLILLIIKTVQNITLLRSVGMLRKMLDSEETCCQSVMTTKHLE